MGLKHISPNESGFDNDKLITETIETHTDHKRHTIPHDLNVGLVTETIEVHTDHKRHTVPHDLNIDLVTDKIKAHEK